MGGERNLCPALPARLRGMSTSKNNAQEDAAKNVADLSALFADSNTTGTGLDGSGDSVFSVLKSDSDTDPAADSDAASTADSTGGPKPISEPLSVRTAIIGSGPAGWTAALYLARAGLSPVVFAGALEPGGQLVNTTTVENYPGFPNGVQGPDLMAAMQQQSEKFGAKVLRNDVARVELPGTDPSDGSSDEKADKILILDSGQTYRTKAVIVTTGSRYRHLGIPGEKRYGGHGVSYCATCDGFFFRGKHVAVVGGGDSAFQDALFLTRFADVTLIHRREGFRASEVLVDRAKANPRIDFLTDTVVSEIEGDDKKVTGVGLQNTKTDAASKLALDGVFVAIGMTPNTGFLGGQLALDGNGYIVTDGGSTRTSVPGVFAAGDVADPVYQQAVSAAGMGCRAALDAQAYLED